MATSAVTAQGSTLKIKSGNAFVKIGGLKDFSGIGGGAPAIIDVTDLDSTGKEKLQGTKDEGSCKVMLNDLPTDVGQIAMRAARDAGGAADFELLVLRSNRKYTFSAFVQTFEVMGGVDKAVEINSTLEITGSVTVTTPTA